LNPTLVIAANNVPPFFRFASGQTKSDPVIISKITKAARLLANRI
jgi:hypothetical protein